MSPCDNQANSCEDSDGNPLVANFSVWVQLLPYGLIGFSEIMASVISLEYAFTKHEMAGAALELVPSLRGYINQNFSPFH